MLDVVAKVCNEFLFVCSWPIMNTFESLFVFVFFLQSYFLFASEHEGSFQVGAAAVARPIKRCSDC